MPNVIERARSAVRRRKNLISNTNLFLNSSGASTAEKNVGIQLTKLKLMELSGNIKDWPKFWSCFGAVVDSKPLSDVEKLS